MAQEEITGEQLTGEQLHARYILPCGDSRLAEGLNPALLNQLITVTLSGGQPEHQLMEECFPRACQRLEEFARRNGLEKWSFNAVAGYWRNDHDRKGECRVRRATVISLEYNRLVVVSVENQELKAVNFYGLLLKSGEDVFLHFRVIIEKAEH